MQKSYFRVLCVFLSVLMAFYAFPLAGLGFKVLAEDGAQASNTLHLGTDIMCEDVSLREENVKYFLRYDGSYTAAVYEQPVHYLDSDGRWQEYDNSIEESNTWLPDSMREYSAAASDMDIRLSKKAKSNKMISLEDIGLSWGYESTLNSTAYAPEADGAVAEYKNKDLRSLSVENMTGTVVYPEIYADIDLEVSITTTGVKEDLILKQKGAQSVFTISYKTDGTLTPVQKDERTVALVNGDGSEAYLLNAPCMWDSAGASSSAVTLTLTESDNKKFTLTLSADSEWLEDGERAYPVCIDPAFTYKPTSASSVYETNGVLLDTTPDFYSSVSENAYAKVGVNYAGGTRHEIVTLSRHTLPSQIKSTSRIIDAQIYLYYYLYASNVYCPTDLQINAHLITGSWTWSGSANVLNNTTLPTWSDTVLDYAFANESEIDTSDPETCYEYFDITEAAQGWLDGTYQNYGILLRSEGAPANDSQYARFITSRHSQYVFNPSFVYNYRDTKGLEGYWSYYSFAAGRHGTGYVNNYTGMLVHSETLFSSAGSRNPYGVTLTFNGANARKRLSTEFSAGYGWMLDSQQRVDAVTDTALIEAGYDYIWLDTDGTEHYFRKKAESTAEWVDEDGLGLTLTVNNGIYIRSESGFELHFYTPEAGGRLYHTKDNYGNTTRYHYESVDGIPGTVLTRIVGATGKTTAFDYQSVSDSNGDYAQLVKITDPAGREYTLSYAETHYLKQITYPDGTYTSFSYSSGQIKTIFTLNERLTISYAAMSNGTRRVTEIKEQAWSSAEQKYMTGENSVTFTYVGSNVTRITDAQGRVTTYIFDNAGRATSIIAPDGSVANASYYSSPATLSNSAPADVKKNNRLTSSSSQSAYVRNYLTNPNMEGMSGYYTAQYTGDSSPDAFSVDTAIHYLGYKSLKLSNTEEGVLDTAYRQIISSPDFAGKSITLSAYVKTDSVSPTDSAKSSGAGFFVSFYDSDEAWISDVYCDNAITGTNDWQRISETFSAPENTASVKVGFALLSSTGEAWFDCAQVECSDCMNTLNLLENSSFTESGSWTGDYFTSSDVVSGQGYMRINGSAAANKYAYQNVEINRANTALILYAKASADGVSRGEALLEATIRYEDGGAEWQSVPFNNYCSDEEQQIILTVVPKRTGVKVSNIGYYIIYRNNENTVEATAAMMSIDESGTSYSYDTDGNMLSAADNAERNQNYTYSDAGEVTSFTDTKSNKYFYGYNTQKPHQLDYLFSQQTYSGMELSYDSYGNLTGVLAGYYDELGYDDTHIDPFGTYTSMSYGYDSTGDYMTSITDERGYSTLYGIDLLKGLTDWVTVPASVGGVDKTLTTRYTYDSNNDTLLSTGIYSSDAPDTLISGVTYTYDSLKRLSRITRTDGQKYNFVYDIWGRVTDIKVGSRVLSHSVYRKTNSNDTQLSYIEYGNTDKIYYTFDNLDRIIAQSTSEGGVPYVSYTYNNDGNIGRVADALSGIVTEYNYDLLGRLTSSRLSGGEVSGYRYTYDTANNLTSYSAKLADGTDGVSGSYFYGEDDRLVRTETDDSTVYYYYDYLGRVYYTRRVDNVTGKVFYTNYQFLAGANGNSTSFVSKVTYSTAQSTSSTRVTVGSIEYTYDTNGFISSVTSKNASGAVTGYEAYTYDALGQLLTVSDGTNTTSYTYDKSGNILTEKYNGTTVGTYTYGDSGWKDLLTAYNGETITYDGIGNPTKYIGWDTLTWSMGRRLMSLSNSTDSVSYTYNADGQRITKTVNGVTTTYYYDDRGTLVLSSCSDGTKLYFYTNADGSIDSFEYNGNHYYYVRNAQNDVIGIVDANGSFVARYTYDAWGNITAITDGAGNDVSANATHIANINPLRYRSYFYDAETGFYYVYSRYYDSEIGRFINADTTYFITATPGALTDKNLFAYCDNNPVVRVDLGGQFWDTIFDIGSLIASTVDVIKNPTDPMAWAGFAADVVSLAVPCVTGGGAVVKAVSKADDVVGAVKAVNKVDNAVDVIDTAGDLARKTDFYITPNGEAIPSTLKAFNENLSKLDYQNGKYIGADSVGPVRVRTNEIHPSDPNFTGVSSVFHTIPHFHIDRRANVLTGKWNKTFTGAMEMLE